MMAHGRSTSTFDGFYQLLSCKNLRDKNHQTIGLWRRSHGEQPFQTFLWLYPCILRAHGAGDRLWLVIILADSSTDTDCHPHPCPLGDHSSSAHNRSDGERIERADTHDLRFDDGSYLANGQRCYNDD